MSKPGPPSLYRAPLPCASARGRRAVRSSAMLGGALLSVFVGAPLLAAGLLIGSLSGEPGFGVVGAVPGAALCALSGWLAWRSTRHRADWAPQVGRASPRHLG